MADTANYESLIDQEVWAFIRRVEDFYPADTAQRSVDEQRAIYNAMCRAFSHPRPASVACADALVESTDHKVPVRRYSRLQPDDRAQIIYCLLYTSPSPRD